MKLDSYIKNMPILYDAVLKTVHIPPSHPMYEKYVNDSIWKYMYGDEKVSSLSNYINIKDMKVLDIGAGIGGLSAAFAKKGAIVTAIDVDDGYQKLSKIGYEECGVDVESQLFDGGDLPFPNESFDIVCCFNIFEHVPNLERLFREMQRVLKQGGIVVGRADYKYSWSNIKSDPHYGLPLNILMPKWFRRWVVVDVTKRNYELGESVWAKNFKDIEKRFDKVGMSTYRWNDDFISVKLPDNDFKRGNKIINNSNEKEFFPYGWYDLEKWGDESVMWSNEKALIHSIHLFQISQVSFELFSIKNKSVWINGIKHNLKRGEWRLFYINCNGNIKIKTSSNKAPKDKRHLGVAIKNIKFGRIENYELQS
jgi:ubiquinone/menaquinone biosynthesis C-methylase UbiE